MSEQPPNFTQQDRTKSQSTGSQFQYDTGLLQSNPPAPPAQASGKSRTIALAAGIGATILATFLLLGAYLAGWFGSADDASTTSTSKTEKSNKEKETAQEEEQKLAEPTVAEKVASHYGTVLDNISTYDFLGGVEPQPGDEITGYDYTLSDITGDQIPELIIQTRAAMLTNVRVFSVNSDADGVIAPE